MDEREWDRDDVGERTAVGEEAGVHRAGQQDMEARMHGRRVEAGGGQAGLPYRHPTAVDDDGDAVGRGAERGGGQPGQRPVGQQHGRKQHVRDQDQPHPHGFRDAAGGEGGVQPKARPGRDEQHRPPTQPDVEQVVQTPACGQP